MWGENEKKKAKKPRRDHKMTVSESSVFFKITRKREKGGALGLICNNSKCVKHIHVSAGVQ